MINGLISPPVFKINNEKIVRRHVYAALFADFWRQHPAMRVVSELMEVEMFQEYLDYLKHISDSTFDYIHRFIPASFPSDVLSQIIEDLTEEEGILQSVRAGYLDELSHIESLRKELIAEGKLGRMHDTLNRVQKTIEEVQIIAFLSRNNLIPKYGFPVDTVELRTDLLQLNSYRSQSNLRLQRDLFQAITDYAPGAEVIADGMMYTSRYIKRPFIKDHDWHQFDFAACSNPECGKITIKRHLREEEHSALIHTKCPNCGSDFRRNQSQTFLVPNYGFIVSTTQPKAVTTKKPRRMSRTQIHYVGDDKNGNEESIRKYIFHGTRLVVSTSKDDELAVINRSSFYVCKTCGYAEEVKGATAKPFKLYKHKTSYGRDCFNNKLVNLTLGHTFKTDVTKITTNIYFEDDRAYTLLYTLLEGLSSYFDIERSDIDGCLHRLKAETGEWSTIFILFDKVPGGAGNANRLGQLSKRQFQHFVECCYDIVASCTCGDNNDGNAACYSCLCNYGNQYYHEIMKRKYAIEFFSQILGIQRRKQEVLEPEISMDIRELTDHVYDTLIDNLTSKEQPETYYELTNDKGECIGQADLAWPQYKCALVDKNDQEPWIKAGWKIISPSTDPQVIFEILKKHK